MRALLLGSLFVAAGLALVAGDAGAGCGTSGQPAGGDGSESHHGGSDSWNSRAGQQYREGAAAGAGRDLSTGDYDPRRSGGGYGGQSPTDYTSQIEALGRAQAADEAAQCAQQSILTPLCAELQRQQLERWRILQDTQTRIYEIQQEVTGNRARTQDRAFDALDAYIRGDGQPPAPNPSQPSSPPPPR